ncbi:hypothetical protein [Effusibacillus consociatus]|uniref:Uncharacterized protein n=1 Tax=Effusibacillus consociatus TaxID=1117041 RepID=A0ABV9Q308_9BACL
MDRQTPEIPQVDLPDEVTQVDMPEIGETTPHPQTPDPQAVTFTESSEAAERKISKIGFAP